MGPSDSDWESLGETEEFFDAEEEETIAHPQAAISFVMTAMLASMMIMQASAAPLEDLDAMDEPNGS